jgi:N6-L-threonylcarbamoyladenine synthase
VLVLGIETSCDETGVALCESSRGLLGHVLHSQARLHADYGGVVPELASRDHVRRLLPLTRALLEQTGSRVDQLSAIAYTEGPGLAGALLVGAATAHGLAYALGIPALGVHHLEAHLLSPLLSTPAPRFPFVALLVSGGHTQLMRVTGVGRYELLGETLDDAAGEAFDKTAKLLGLGYPGGPALARLAERGKPGRYRLPRPMISSGDLDFSFSGLKTAVLTLVRSQAPEEDARADLAAEIEAAIVDVLAVKALAAVERAGLDQLVVAGGVGANLSLRKRLATEAAKHGLKVYYPELEFCTDNGAMIAFAAAKRLQADPSLVTRRPSLEFTVRPRWDLDTLALAR